MGSRLHLWIISTGNEYQPVLFINIPYSVAKYLNIVWPTESRPLVIDWKEDEDVHWHLLGSLVIETTPIRTLSEVENSCTNPYLVYDVSVVRSW